MDPPGAETGSGHGGPRGRSLYSAAMSTSGRDGGGEAPGSGGEEPAAPAAPVASVAPGASVALAAPVVPVLIVQAKTALWLATSGRSETIDHGEAARRARATPPVLCHGAVAAARLGVARFASFDLLELYAFVRPAQFVLPTVPGLAAALGRKAPRNPLDAARFLRQAADLLLDELGRLKRGQSVETAEIAAGMAQAGWLWGKPVLAALNRATAEPGPAAGLDIWNRLPEWNEPSPLPAPSSVPVGEGEARERLRQLLGEGAEARSAQSDYAAAAAAAFAPRERAGQPNLVLAEAGTGIGKTLGYIAPASLWAEKNGGAVWLSTFTKALQRQLDQELDRLYPDPALKAARVVVRKGRENYLCLLNFAEAAQARPLRAEAAVALGLMARWARASRDGDMAGGDFPAWLGPLLGAAHTVGLTDRRGECIYAACPHYRRCFIERAIRKARRADLVIANHALVMLMAAQAEDGRELPVRYVFDEGHHLFGAADNAFSAHLSGAEGVELRRWLRGSEGGRKSRARGLEKRIGDLVAADAAAQEAMSAVLRAATALPAEGWLDRLRSDNPLGPAERFLALLRQQVLARARPEEGLYSLETQSADPVAGLLPAAEALALDLARLSEPMAALARALAALLDDEAAALESASRVRIEAAVRSLERRRQMLESWRAMLGDLAGATPEGFVDWFALERSGGHETDAGFHRHWLDPTTPFAAAVLNPAHGALITSATLRDQSVAEGQDGEDALWQSAEMRTGAQHLALPARRIGLASPFDYSARTRILVVTDVRRDDVAQVSAAYRELFLSAGGGGLGLFTAIWRLRAVEARIRAPLEEAGIPLYAQHVDALDTASLVDIFRADTDACLLGTDAVRDGVDVPGRSLRLIVFDRVPWPRPDILHRARRKAFGGQAYDDMLTRLKLKQAYGRLLRRADDAGVFVMLDAMLPSRLLPAFPPDVAVQRCGLAEALAVTRAFLPRAAEDA